MTHHELLDRAIRDRREAMIEELRAVVEHETPSLDKVALDGLAHTLAARFEAMGAETSLIPNTVGGMHVRAAFGTVDGARPTLVLAHYDTVWPLGTIGRMPFRVEGVKAFGPGVFDMKASLVMITSALDAIQSLGLTLANPVVVLVTSDEEIGSPRTRVIIEDEARASAQTLVMEPPLADGSLKTARKGVGHFHVSIEGRASHAGVEPEKGINAIVELARQILVIEALANPKLGTTLSTGVISGGTTSNVVPAHASAAIDARVVVMTEEARIVAAFQSLTPIHPGAKVHARGDFDRPPMERSAAVAGLYERIKTIGSTIGLTLGEGSTGGASDGNFTAAIGVPTVDGLGCPGGGAHADSEHILIDGFLERTVLLATLLLNLGPQ